MTDENQVYSMSNKEVRSMILSLWRDYIYIQELCIKKEKKNEMAIE